MGAKKSRCDIFNGTTQWWACPNMLRQVGSLDLTIKLSDQMSMAHLINGQNTMVNLTKPYPFNMANLIKPWPF